MKEMKLAVRSHADSLYAGALGAALWGAYRFDKLAHAARFTGPRRGRRTTPWH